MPVSYETFEHQADIGIRGFGGSVEEAFENAARALYSVIVKIENVRPRDATTFTVSAPDWELLLVEWLNALLSKSDLERMVYSKFSVEIKGTKLTGTAWGEQLDRDQHRPKIEVKAATYHQLHVDEKDGRYTAQCVVDV
jgi:SHS2 domain-containing protein